MKRQACALLAALIMIAVPAYGQGWNIELVGTKYQAWQNAKFVASQGNYAYVGVNFSGPWNTALSVVDVTDSENPVEVAYCDLDVIYDIRALEVTGDYAYVGFWNNQGWTIVDIANPLHPFVLYHSLTPNSVYDFQACDSLFYVLHSANSGSTGMMIFDISNPVFPAILGHYILPNQGTHIAVSGEYAYVSQSSGGLSVIDVSDPTLPVQVSSLALPTTTFDVVAADNYAYLTGSVGGMNTGVFYAVNVSNPLAPYLAGSLTIPGASNGLRELEISGNVAVAGAFQEGFYILDIAQPANPMLLGHWDSPPGSDILRDLAEGGDCVYAAYDYNGLAVINISNPQIPAYICSYQPDWIILDVVTEGNIAYLAAGNDGLLINDVSDPVDPWQTAQLTDIGSAGAIQISGNYAYVQTYVDSLRIVDVADPSNPLVVGSYNGWIYKVLGSLAYATADEGILKILDMSDPINPLEIGSYQQPGAYLFNLDTDGRFLYAMAAYIRSPSVEDSLLILDVNDPTNPQFSAIYLSEDGDRHLVLGGGYLYAAGGLTGLIVYSVADPANLIQVGRLAMQPSPSDMLLSGDFVYLTFGGFNVGLRIVDVSDPTNPVLTGYYDTEAFANGIAVNGDYAYVADWDYFEIYDCSDATHNDVEVSIIPLMQPIQIPASGGSFDYYIFAENNRSNHDVQCPTSVM